MIRNRQTHITKTHHIIVKIQEIEHKNRALKAVREKETNHLQKKTHQTFQHKSLCQGELSFNL